MCNEWDNIFNVKCLMCNVKCLMFNVKCEINALCCQIIKHYTFNIKHSLKPTTAILLSLR